jgi:hypothetical protein
MDQSTQGSTGGSVPTGNPQNIGIQSLGAPTSEGPTKTSNLLNSGASLRLTDQNGQPLKVNTTTQIPAQSPVAKSKSITGVVIITCLIVVVVVMVVAWLLNKNEPVPEPVVPAPAAKPKNTQKKKKKKKKK